MEKWLDPAAPKIEIVDGLATARDDHARDLLFEYMAATELAAGRSTVTEPSQLPAVLRNELADPRITYAPPGTVLLALHRGEAVGCLAFQLVSDDTAEFKRFYVRPTARRTGAARALVNEGERIATSLGLRRVVGDVVPTRTAVIAWYRRMGFQETNASRSGPHGLVEMVRELKP